jgi:hypothetical protein
VKKLVEKGKDGLKCFSLLDGQCSDSVLIEGMKVRRRKEEVGAVSDKVSEEAEVVSNGFRVIGKVFEGLDGLKSNARKVL